ncbi:alpha/beta hydrolase [Nitrospira sp.]|nr:alpha/beta hydrolase [Nitrospira sp.]
MLMLLAACTTVERPVWFDGIHRVALHSVQIDGHRLAYLDEGSGSPLILIHGFGGSMWQWEYQSTALARGFRVVTLDLLGSGFSDKPALEYRPEEVLHFFRAFMDALRIERATLVGNSMGAGVAIGMALTAPERVDRLVLISGLPADVKGKLESPLVRRALESSMPAWLVRVGSWFVGSSATDRVLKEIVFDHSQLTPAVLDRSRRNRRATNYIGPVLAIGRTVPIWESDYAPRLSQVRQRTLVLWGEEDRVFPLTVGREFAASLPYAEFVAVPNAGHIPMWEQPDVVNRSILEFLDRP